MEMSIQHSRKKYTICSFSTNSKMLDLWEEGMVNFSAVLLLHDL